MKDQLKQISAKMSLDNIHSPINQIKEWSTTPSPDGNVLLDLLKVGWAPGIIFGALFWFTHS